jgi:hypothetical protein
MELNLNVPALLFPTISLLMLAYTNRFLAIASLVRNLHKQYNEKHDPRLIAQIRNLRLRLTLIQNTQALGVMCIFCSVLTMFFIFFNEQPWATVAFATSLLLLMVSLTLSLTEIYLSTKALRIELADIEKELGGRLFNFSRKSSTRQEEDEV